MNECGWLTDRIPEVALGRAEWTPEEIRHLGECRMCREELEMVQAASHIGRAVGESVDVGSTADAVLRRIKRERIDVGRRRSWTFAGLATAAAIALALWTGGQVNRPSRPAAVGLAAAGRLSIPLPELDGLEPAELDSVLQTMDAPTGSTLDSLGSGDSMNDDLDLVLDSWEG
jgi:hypothetical protein